MILDALLRVATSQTFNGASEVSADSVDLASFQPAVSPTNPLTPSRRVGTGEPLCAVFFVETAAAGAGASSSVWRLQVIESAAATLTTPNVLQERDFNELELTAGSVIVVDIPVGQPTLRYLGVNVDLPASSGTIVMSVFIGPRSFVDSWLAYRRGYVV